MNTDNDTDAARLARHRDLHRVVHPDIAATNRGLFRHAGCHVIKNDRGEYFHFWNKATYGEPQFGDAYHAHYYKTLAGASARHRALTADGYKVKIESL